MKFVSSTVASLRVAPHLVDWATLVTSIMLFCLVFYAIFTSRNVDRSETTSAQKCQEVVVQIEPTGHVLAQCPTGTYIEIVDGDVICRCGVRQLHVDESTTTELFMSPLSQQETEMHSVKDDTRGCDL